MFWKMSYADTSPIDAILEKSEFTLEDLLDEDHIIQESKGENEKLLAFLTREEVLAKLIQCAFSLRAPCSPSRAAHITATQYFEAHAMYCCRYVITAKDAGTEDKVKLKYPYVASELLSLELECIYGAILRSEELSRSLFGFLRCCCCVRALGLSACCALSPVQFPQCF